MLIFSLRREAPLSGEAASLCFLQQTLQDIGIDCQIPVASASSDSPGMAALRRWQQLRAISATNSTDLLLVKIPTGAQLPLVVRATRKFHGRLIFWIDGLLWRPLPQKQMRALFAAEPALTSARAFLNNALWLRPLRDASLEIVISSETQKRELAAHLRRARFYVVPNGSPNPQDNTASKDHANAEKTFGYIGHSYLTKGVWDLLEAHRLLRSRNITLPVVFALSGLGDHTLRRTLIRESVAVRGEVNRHEFYASLRALVAPFWTDWGTQTFPNILLESLQAGVPVITSDLPVCREIFGNELAVFVPPHDPSTLAETLDNVYSGRHPLASPAKLQLHFNQHFSAGRIAAGWSDIIDGSGRAATSAPR